MPNIATNSLATLSPHQLSNQDTTKSVDYVPTITTDSLCTENGLSVQSEQNILANGPGLRDGELSTKALSALTSRPPAPVAQIETTRLNSMASSANAVPSALAAPSSALKMPTHPRQVNMSHTGVQEKAKLPRIPILYKLVSITDGWSRKIPLEIGGLTGKTLETVANLIGDITGLFVEELELKLTTSAGESINRFHRGEEAQYTLGVEEFTEEIKAQYKSNKNKGKPFILSVTPTYRKKSETSSTSFDDFTL
jgi:hypothetical protein